MLRATLNAEDISQALLDAGIELRPDDCSSVKFWKVADIMTEKLHQQVRKELEHLAATVLARRR